MIVDLQHRRESIAATTQLKASAASTSPLQAIANIDALDDKYLKQLLLARMTALAIHNKDPLHSRPF